MPRAFRRTARPKALLAPALLLLAVSGCVSLQLTESTKPFPGRQWPNAPTIAVAEAADRRPNPDELGRVGFNSLRITGNAGAKFRNALMTSLNEHAYNVRFVGNVNVLDPASVAAAVRGSKADFLLTAAVLDIRAFSVDPFFDPTDVDFTAQVNLLDGDGRTRYTRHIHVHKDRRLWFNPAFGARDMLDDQMEHVADFVSTDAELVRVMSEPLAKPAPARAAAPAEGSRPISSTEPAPPGTEIPPPESVPVPTGPPATIPLSEIPEAPPPAEAPAPEAAPPPEPTVPATEAPAPETTEPPAEAPPPVDAPPPAEAAPPSDLVAPGETAVPEEVRPPETGTPEEAAPAAEEPAPSDEPPAPEESVPPREEVAPPADETPPEGAIAPGEEVVPAPPERDPVFVDPGASP